MKVFGVTLVACLALAFSGCVSPYGLVYTHTYEPLSTDFHSTPVVTDQEAGDVKEISYYVRVLWSGNAIGDIAREHGFETVNYADLETLRVLGVWTQRWAHVYGTRKLASEAPGAR